MHYFCISMIATDLKFCLARRVLSVQQNWKPQVIGDLTVKFPWYVASVVPTYYCC
jgi:hypothetical protein